MAAKRSGVEEGALMPGKFTGDFALGGGVPFWLEDDL